MVFQQVLVGTFWLQALSACVANAALGNVHIGVSELLPTRWRRPRSLGFGVQVLGLRI